MRVHSRDFGTAHHVRELPREFHRVLIRQMRIAFEAESNIELGDEVAHVLSEGFHHLIERVNRLPIYASRVEM